MDTSASEVRYNFSPVVLAQAFAFAHGHTLASTVANNGMIGYFHRYSFHHIMLHVYIIKDT